MEVCKFIEVREGLRAAPADGFGGVAGGLADADVAGGLADADVAGEFGAGEAGLAPGRAEVAGALGEALAVPGYWTVFEGSVEVEFDLWDETGFGNKVVGFKGSAGAGLIRVRGGLPEDMPL
jgi:hypothetical protein